MPGRQALQTSARRMLQQLSCGWRLFAKALQMYTALHASAPQNGFPPPHAHTDWTMLPARSRSGASSGGSQHQATWSGRFRFVRLFDLLV